MSRFSAPLSGTTMNWVRDPNLMADALFAGLVAVVVVVEASSPDATTDVAGADTFAYVTIVVGAASLLFRRHFPITVLVIVTAVLVTFYLRDGGEFLSLLGLSAFYAVAAHSGHRRRAWTALLAAGAILFAAASVSVIDKPDGYDTSDAAGMASFLIGVSVVGLFVRNRQRIFADSEQRAAAAEADRRAGAERAVATERNRIAREMHDIVAHGMSVIAVQAAAAKEVVHTDPDTAAEVLGRIEDVGRESLDEMRRMLGVLRNGDDSHTEASLAPQPGLADVEAAITQSNDAGVATTLVVSGEERELPAGIGLTAFRIVQESLTNVLKHAGQAASAVVTITYGPDTVTVEVVDDGRGAVSSLSDVGGGNGLIGMRERVDIYGGELSTGPRAGGGYAVRAVLPVADTAGHPSVASAASPTREESP